MKNFTIIKIGYSSGVYGCSNEFFVCTYSTPTKFGSFHFNGMYGTEERISRTLTDKGFKAYYTPSRFGKLTGEDKRHAERWGLSEEQAVKFVDGGFNGLAVGLLQRTEKSVLKSETAKVLN